MKQPNFFIVGAPKCGTTAMNDYLDKHDEIFMATKELHYFGADLPVRNKISLREYLSRFEKVSSEKIVGEASVWYLYSKTAAIEISKFSPDAKILIMLRNPVEVMHSLHSQNLFDANEDVADFEEALNLEDDRSKGVNLPNSLEFTALPTYTESVLYYLQVKRYLDVFGSKKVKVILYEDFATNTAKAVSDTLAFLGLPINVAATFRQINPNKKLRFHNLHLLVKNPSAGLKRFVQTILPSKTLRHRLMALIFKLNVTGKKREPLKPEITRRLKAVLTEDIIQLEQLINRDLSSWR